MSGCYLPERRVRTAFAGPGYLVHGGWEITAIGTWYLSLGVSLFLVLTGIYIHWSVVVVGALLPLWPMIATLVGRRRARHTGRNGDAAGPAVDQDGHR